MTGKQLKNSILQWAIQGKLVPQDPNDEPASVLLEKIRAEKARLVKEGKLKKKDLEVKPIAEDEIPFEIPKGWEWCRLNDILSLKSGECIKINSLKKNARFPVYGGNGINGTYEKYNVDFGTLIIGRVGYYCGSVHKTLSKAWVTDNALVVSFYEKYINVDFLKHVLSWLNLSSTSNSTAQPVVSGKGIYPLLFPLPPLAEQHRIVAKIEELMPLVEKYGAAQETLEELNNYLPEKLKKSILQEAIQGKLVPQDPADEPASILLKRICEEKKRLVKEGKLKKKDLEVRPIEEDEIPFEIPESWEWCKIEDITIPIGNKINQIQSKEVLKIGKVPVVSQGQKLIDGYSNEVDKTIEELPLVMFGDHTRNVKLIDFPFVIGADGTKFFKPILCDAQFVYYLVLYEASKLRNRGYARHYTLLKDEPLPLPPLAEQRRIVSRIEELFEIIKK